MIMNEKEPLKVMTLQLNAGLVAKLGQNLEDLCLRRDVYLSKQLAREIEKLNELPANSDIVAGYLRLGRQHSVTSMVKVGIKLPEPLVSRINAVCAEKRVPRDLFVETFMRFLTNGAPEFGVDASPLDKASEYINDPYWDALGNPNIYRKSCQPSEDLIGFLRSFDAPEDPPMTGNDDGQH